MLGLVCTFWVSGAPFVEDAWDNFTCLNSGAPWQKIRSFIVWRTPGGICTFLVFGTPFLDDTCGIYCLQTIGMMAVAMEYDYIIATNCNFIFVEMRGATMVIHDAN